MKKYILIALLTSTIVSCSRKDGDNENGSNLGTIKFTTTQSDQNFTGALEIFPCTINTTTYVGNYHLGSASVINSSCVIVRGGITTWGYELLLPIGTYNMVYWGVSNYPIYKASRVTPPSLRIGANLSTLSWSMVLNPDKTTYMPVWDQVMGVQDIQIGSTGLSVNLKRKVAGLNVIVKNSNGGEFDSSISSFEVMVGGVAEKVNMVTGDPENQTKTVRFGLTIDPTTRKSASNITAMLYPSTPTPPITITINLVNGQTKSYTTTLRDALLANSMQTITILMADILASDPQGSTFTVDSWDVTSETIDAPILQAPPIY